MSNGRKEGERKAGWRDGRKEGEREGRDREEMMDGWMMDDG